MAVEPISFTKLLKKTDDIYEAVVVSSKRQNKCFKIELLNR